jgi:hypothetical protein
MKSKKLVYTHNLLLVELLTTLWRKDQANHYENRSRMNQIITGIYASISDFIHSFPYLDIANSHSIDHIICMRIINNF